MTRELPEIAGVTFSRTLPSAARWAHHLVVGLPGPCETASSAPLGGGVGHHRYILNRSVDKNWRTDKPEDDPDDNEGIFSNDPGQHPDTARYAEHLGLPAAQTVGLITAVSMANLTYAGAEREGWRVHTLVTAGVGNAAAAGGRFPLDEALAGTVNLIVLIEGRLSPSALVGAVQTTTEAKVAAFRAAFASKGVTTRFGKAATGTTTDTVTVVNLTDAPRSLYAGTATAPGFLVAQTVYQALTAAL